MISPCNHQQRREQIASMKKATDLQIIRLKYIDQSTFRYLLQLRTPMQHEQNSPVIWHMKTETMSILNRRYPIERTMLVTRLELVFVLSLPNRYFEQTFQSRLSKAKKLQFLDHFLKFPRQSCFFCQG